LSAKLHILAGLQQRQCTPDPGACTPAIPINSDGNGKHMHAHVCAVSLSFLPTWKEEQTFKGSFNLQRSSDPSIWRAISTPSRHLQGRRWKTIPLSLHEQRCPSFLFLSAIAARSMVTLAFLFPHVEFLYIPLLMQR